LGVFLHLTRSPGPFACSRSSVKSTHDTCSKTAHVTDEHKSTEGVSLSCSLKTDRCTKSFHVLYQLQHFLYKPQHHHVTFSAVRCHFGITSPILHGCHFITYSPITSASPRCPKKPLVTSIFAPPHASFAPSSLLEKFHDLSTRALQASSNPDTSKWAQNAEIPSPAFSAHTKLFPTPRALRPP
jgi:hypothetical protein